jgi:glycosyltransferase involved in cell wall biosynthesis
VAPDIDERPTRLSVLVLNWRDRTNPEGGGSERYVEEVATRLQRAGHEVTLLCADHGQAPRDDVRDGVRIVRRGGKLGVYPRALAFVASQGRRYDVVVDVQNGVPFVSPLVRRRPVMVLVHHVHREQWPVVYGGAVARFGWWLESWLAPRVYRDCAYVAVSSSTRTELSSLGVDERRIAVVHNGIDPPSCTGRPPSAEPRLLVLSRLVPHKQIDHALIAVARLRDRHPGVSLDVVGDGWWRPHLERQAMELGISQRVRFHGHVDESTKEELLAGTQLMLFPSLKEGWGLVVIEAAGHAVPTIAYRGAGGVTESIVDGRTGLLVDDLDELVTATADLLDDAARRHHMGAAARERAATFSWESTAENFEKALVSAASRRRRQL